jgi:hypothetical protein
MIQAIDELTAAGEVVGELAGRDKDNEITVHVWKAAQDLRVRRVLASRRTELMR